MFMPLDKHQVTPVISQELDLLMLEQINTQILQAHVFFVFNFTLEKAKNKTKSKKTQNLCI